MLRLNIPSFIHMGSCLSSTRQAAVHAICSAGACRRLGAGIAGIICDQTISLDGFYTRQDYPELLQRIRFKDPESGKTLVFITNILSAGRHHRALYKSRWQVELFFKWIAASSDQAVLRPSENAVKTQIGIAVSVYVLVAIVKKRLDLDASLYTVTDPLGDPLRDDTSSTCGRRKQMQRFANNHRDF